MASDKSAEWCSVLRPMVKCPDHEYGAPNRKPRYFFGEYSASSEVEWDVGHESGTLKAWGRALCGAP
jgi:hypothetical protein